MERAEKLVEIGFFEKRGSKEQLPARSARIEHGSGIIERLDMRTKSRSGVVTACVIVFCALGVAGDGSEPMRAKAAKLFGNPLRTEHEVFRLNDDYVIWLSFDTRGDLFQVDVGPCF